MYVFQLSRSIVGCFSDSLGEDKSLKGIIEVIYDISEHWAAQGSLIPYVIFLADSRSQAKCGY